MASNEDKQGFTPSKTPVGQYYLLDKIAQGGMAEIYKGLAYDLHGLKKTVVIKKILPQIAADPEFVQMLINEAKIAVMLSHGNIAQIHDLGKVGEDYFMVMEYVDGKSLSQIHKRSLKKGNLIPTEYACYFIAEVANGLNYMHKRSDAQGRNLGIIHRDISPQNIIVSYSGTVKIIDFGIAKAAIQMNITDSGVLKGKFAYMSPEQARGDMIDHRSDIFSLGVILHEILTGKRLFKGQSKKETLQNVRKAYVPAPSSLRADLTSDIDRIVKKALSKDPKNRYMWASELHDDLIKFIYSNYPDFKPSTIADYVRNLFIEDIEEREEHEEDALTPFLIIDHTQSAILPEHQENTDIIKVPPQLKEFMLEEATPLPIKEEEEEEALEHVEEEKEPKEPFDFKRFISSHWKGLTISFLAALISLFAAFTFLVNNNYIKTPNFLIFLKSKTKLVIKVEPQDAQVYFGGVLLQGTPPYKLKNIKPGIDYQLILEKEGFIPETRSILLKSGEKRSVEISLKKEPPHYAEIMITSSPSGAAIFLDEKDTNLRTPADLTGLIPEKIYTIGLFLDDHIFWSRDVKLKRDERKSITAELAIDYAALDIYSYPAGAQITLNGKISGKTPYKNQKVDPNELIDVTITMQGFHPWSGKIKTKAGKANVIRARLERTKEYLRPHFLRNLEKEKIKELEEKNPADTSPEIMAPAPIQ